MTVNDLISLELQDSPYNLGDFLSCLDSEEFLFFQQGDSYLPSLQECQKIRERVWLFLED